MSNGVRGSAATMVFACLVQAPAAHADETGDTGENGATQSVTVSTHRAAAATSATKTDTPIAETPQSVSVVTRDQIEDQGAATVSEALRYTASVQSEQRGASTAGAPYLFSRGFYLEQFLDGARLPSDSSFGYGIANFDAYGLERIEVLHGPASVLYGQANPGGVADLVSKQPVFTPLHEVFVQGGSYARKELGFDFGGALDAASHLAYRLTAVGVDANTQVDGVKERRVYVAPALTWKPDDATTLTLLAKVQRDPDAGYYDYLPAVGTVLSNPNGQISRHFNPGDPDFDHHSRTQYAVGYRFERRLDATWTVRQNLSYNVVSDDLANVFPYPNGYADADKTTINRYAFTNRETSRFLSVDNQVQARLRTGAIEHTALAGFDYQRVLFNQTVGSDFFEPQLDVYTPVYQAITAPTPGSNDHIRMSQFGLYAQDQLAWRQWRLLAGVREDSAHADDVNPLSPYPTSDETLRSNNHAFTWRTGLVYLFDNGLAPYASYSDSFTPQVGATVDGALLKPTTARQFEAGLRYQPKDGSGSLTVAVFDLTERNVTTGDTENNGYSVQAGEVRARGLELSGHARLTERLGLDASYAYLDDVQTRSDVTATAVDGSTVSQQGKRPWGVPRNTASAWLDYALPASVIEGLSVGGGARYVGVTQDQSNTLDVPGRTLFDAGLRYAVDAHWQLSVNGKNLFDRVYVASCQTSGICNYGDGREVIATARYRW